MSLAARSSSEPRAFQFRIATLLVAMAWIGVVCTSLRTPTGFWSSLAFLVTLAILLTSGLTIVYRRRHTRAFAVGFLVFKLGFLSCAMLLPDPWMNSFWHQGSYSLNTWLYVGITPGRSHGYRTDYFQVTWLLMLATLLGVLGGIVARALYVTGTDPR